MLQRILPPKQLDSRKIPPEISEMIASVMRRVEAFQDRWDQPQMEQFVAADYELVYQHLDWIGETQLLIGRRFLEWGCGFAAVTLMAAHLGWDAYGVEIENALYRQAEITSREWSTVAGPVCLSHANFLPDGAEWSTVDPTLPSLGHGGRSTYDELELELDDFAIVYSYPWPGEEGFHQEVFDRFGGVGAILVQFCGPYDVQLHRRHR